MRKLKNRIWINKKHELWKKIKSLKRKNKLSSSFEIWSPEDKRQNSNGVQILKQIEIAGGALVLEEDGVEPAFKDAKVLTVAKKTKEVEYLNQLWDDREIWGKLFNQVERWDELINEFNDRTGLLK